MVTRVGTRTFQERHQNLPAFSGIASELLRAETRYVNNFIVLQYPTGKFEILELTGGADPVDLARKSNAFLVGITASRSRAEFIVSRESHRSAARVVQPA